MIGQILATLLPVFLIAGSGAAYGRFRTPDIRSLNTLNMELFVPLLVFAVLADRQAPLAEYAWLASAAINCGQFILTSKRYGCDRFLHGRNINLKRALSPVISHHKSL